jgi:general secretion pathway protein M
VPRLNAQKHAAASLSILIAVLVLFYSIIIYPAVSGRMQFQERYEELQFQFSKLGDSKNKSQQLKKELAYLGSQETDKTGFLENKPEALAAADLQKHIKTLIESSEGSLISTQVVQQKEDDIFPQVTVKVHLRGNIEALRNILFRLNTEHPVLLINNLLVQKRHGSGGRRPQRRADQLEVRFDITGFMYQAEAS